MTKIFPLRPTIELLNVVHDKNYPTTKFMVFTPLTENEHDRFNTFLHEYLTYPNHSDKRVRLDVQLYKIFGFCFGDVVALGDTKLEPRLASTWLESNKLRFDKIEKNNYKCFVYKDWKDPQNKMNLPYHESGACSWNCLMVKLKNPKFGVVYNIRDEEKHKFKINE